MNSLWIGTALVASFVVVGCAAPVGVRGVSVPADAAATCARHCEGIGLQLSAVAIMANNVGCVCQKGGGAGSASASVADETGAATAGMATIAMQVEEEQQQQQQQQRQTQH